VDFPDFFFFANPNLKPEESLGWDIGFEQPFMNDRFRVGVTYFHNDIKNLIQGTFDPVTFISSVDNIGQATTSGVEVFARWAVTDRFGLRADYTYTEAVNEDTGEQLLRRPKHKGSLTATWLATDALSLSGTIIQVGPYLDRDRFFSQPPFMTDGFTLVNLAAEYKINDNVAIFGRADNLLDVHYQDPTGFERPGLGVFAGLRFTNR
jgi:vitamin B12 transporter